ncbi:hypothetical protein KDW_42560 [Dictyobacter vulcani]|uniref:Uncharacterized protein n=1 Tax=Dictyobacter vulcani TaxID=2607529 RepID=A0A5J4KKY5_9CHLR|nr:hypothetical protein [Dictyobacter vulcani]GER90094.1 hypothetical protein KDW_42560 [Dictyobacter vulcani]
MNLKTARVEIITVIIGAAVALLAFFAVPYISLGFLGTYTAPQVAGGLLGSSSAKPALWLEALVGFLILALAAGAILAPLKARLCLLLVIPISAITLLIILFTYISQSQEQSIFGSTASFYSTGFWLYGIGILVSLVGASMSVKHFSAHQGGNIYSPQASNLQQSQPDNMYRPQTNNEPYQQPGYPQTNDAYYPQAGHVQHPHPDHVQHHQPTNDVQHHPYTGDVHHPHS